LPPLPPFLRVLFWTIGETVKQHRHQWQTILQTGWGSSMALPLAIPAIAAGGTYLYGKFGGSDDEPTSTAVSVFKVAFVALAAYGTFKIYQNMKR